MRGRFDADYGVSGISKCYYTERYNTGGAVPAALFSWKPDRGSKQNSLAVLLFACCLPADSLHATYSLQTHCVPDVKSKQNGHTLSGCFQQKGSLQFLLQPQQLS